MGIKQSDVLRRLRSQFREVLVERLICMFAKLGRDVDPSCTTRLRQVTYRTPFAFRHGPGELLFPL